MTKARELSELGDKITVDGTGVDVTGTVTADGLTVDQGSTATLNLSSGAASWGMVAFGDPDDADVGRFFYDHGNNALTTRTAATNRMQIAGNGDISFYEDTGTTPKFFWDASAERLYIGDGTYSNDGFFLSGFSGGYQIFNTKASDIRIATNNSEVMRITSSGNVGIGTSSPSLGSSGSGLHIKGASGKYGVLKVDSSTTSEEGWVQFSNNGVDKFRIASDSSTNLKFIQSGVAERARIDASGNLLVGTTNADIGGSVTGIKLAQSGAFYASTDETSTLFSQTLYADRRGTNNQGDILALGLNGYIKASIGVIGTSGSSNDGGIIFNTIEGNANKTERMRIEASGRVGIGTSAPQQRLQVDGDPIGTYTQGFTSQLGLQRSSADSTGPRAHYEFRNPNGLVGSISTSSSSTSFNTSSDYRLKENVVALDGAADRLAQIPVHRFNFIADPDTTVDGFLAHEVQAIVPEAVTGEKDAVDADGNPEYQGIDQSKLVPLLTAALQEALTEIENLKARVAALEGA